MSCLEVFVSGLEVVVAVGWGRGRLHGGASIHESATSGRSRRQRACSVVVVYLINSYTIRNPPLTRDAVRQNHVVLSGLAVGRSGRRGTLEGSIN